MFLLDYIFLGVAAFAIIIGLLAGHHTLNKMISEGFVGLIFKWIIAYFTMCALLNISALYDIVYNWHNTLASGGAFLQFLAKIHVELYLPYLACIIGISIIVKLGVLLNGMLTDRICGVLLSVVIVAILVLVFGQVMYLVAGIKGQSNFFTDIVAEGSKLGIDKVFNGNLLLSIVPLF